MMAWLIVVWIWGAVVLLAWSLCIVAGRTDDAMDDWFKKEGGND